MILTGVNGRTLRKTCPSATLPVTNPTWTDPGDETPETNRLSHSTEKYYLQEVLGINYDNCFSLYTLIYVLREVKR
jgi:hypothetical protein